MIWKATPTSRAKAGISSCQDGWARSKRRPNRPHASNREAVFWPMMR